MDTCLFCKVVRKELYGAIVYEDADVIAFLDIHPVHPGHTLVVPKVHTEDFSTMDPVDREAVMHACQKVTHALLHNHIDGVNVITNVRPAAGQTIFHAHFHLIPRYHNDGLLHLPHSSYKDGEAEEWEHKIKSALK
jgi:histidine triad (HIT) family protein